MGGFVSTSVRGCQYVCQYMARVVLQHRVDAGRKALWVEAAVAAGLSLSAWVGRACDEAAALEAAAARESALAEGVATAKPAVAVAPGLGSPAPSASAGMVLQPVGDLAAKWKPDPRR